MIKNEKLNIQVFVLLIATILISIIVFLLKDAILFYFGPDAYSYVDAAKKLWTTTTPDPIRPIGIPLLLGVPLSLTHNVNEIIGIYMLFNIIAYIGSFALVFNIARILTNSRRLGMITALIFMFSVSHAVHLFLVLSETVFLFLILLSIWCLLQYFLKKKLKYLSFCYGILLISLIVKPVMLYVVLIATVYYIFKLPKVVQHSFSFILVLLCSGMVSYQLFLMNKYFDEYKISYVDNITWYYYLGAQSKALQTNTSYEEVRAKRYENTEDFAWEKKAPEAQQDLKEQLTTNKRHIFEAYWNNMRTNFFAGNAVLKSIIHKGNTSPSLSRWYRVSSWQNTMYYVLFVLTWILFLVNRATLKSAYRSFTLIVLLVVSYIYATSGITFTQGDRLTLIAQPLVLLLFISQLLFIKKRNASYL